MASPKLTESLALLATLDPAVRSANTYNTDVVDLSLFPRTIWALLVGAYGAAAATINIQLYANTTNSTSGGTAISGKTFSAATFSGSAAGTNDQGLIHLLASEAQAALPGARYVYGVVTVATDTVGCALAVFGGTARYEDASVYDLASVTEIIS